MYHSATYVEQVRPTDRCPTPRAVMIAQAVFVRAMPPTAGNEHRCDKRQLCHAKTKVGDDLQVHFAKHTYMPDHWVAGLDTNWRRNCPAPSCHSIGRNPRVHSRIAALQCGMCGLISHWPATVVGVADPNCQNMPHARLIAQA